MTPTRILILIMVALFGCLCSAQQPSAHEIDSSVSSIRRYLDSFTGIDIDKARGKLSGAAVTEEEWHHGASGGKVLIANFHEFELRIYLHNAKVVTASFQTIVKNKPKSPNRRPEGSPEEPSPSNQSQVPVVTHP